MARRRCWPNWVAAGCCEPRQEATAAAGEAAEKPAPDLVLLALGRLGVSAADAIYVGDSDSDRRAAHAAGVRMVGLRTDGDPRIEWLREVIGLIG